MKSQSSDLRNEPRRYDLKAQSSDLRNEPRRCHLQTNQQAISEKSVNKMSKQKPLKGQVIQNQKGHP